MSIRKQSIVLLLSGYDATGGAEQQAHLFSAELSRRGYRVLIITRKLSLISKKLDSPGVLVKRVPVFGGKNLEAILYILQAFLLALFWRIRRTPLLAIYSFQCDSPLIAGCLMKKLFNTKLVARVAGGDWQRLKTSKLFQFFARKADYLWILNPQLAQDALKIVEEEKILFIPNGVDTNTFSPPSSREEKSSLRTEFKIPLDRRVFVYVGRLEEVKGIDVLLQAWQSEERAGGNSVLLIVGEGSLESLVSLKSLPGVIFLGPKGSSEIVRILKASDVFILPSRYEGMSNALLEAIATGLPVLATGVGATPEIFNKGHIGFLVDPDDHHSLIEGLKFFSELDAGELLLIRQETRRTALDNYSLDKMVDRHLGTIVGKEE